MMLLPTLGPQASRPQAFHLKTAETEFTPANGSFDEKWYWFSLASHSHRGFSPVIGRLFTGQAAVSTASDDKAAANR